jgi:hypothetical protein
MRKRKFTGIDSQPWIVADVNGRARSFYYHDKQGKKVIVKSFDGYRWAAAAAKKFGGTAVRQ